MKRWIVYVLVLVVWTGWPGPAHTQQQTERPPRPGKYYIWVPPVKQKNGQVTPGYWKYVPPPERKKIWIPGHRAANGQWIPGHYRYVIPPSPNAVWVPPFKNPHGKWIPGHWKIEKD